MPFLKGGHSIERFHCTVHVTYHQGICPIGIKKPLVNPVTEARMGERRIEILGKVRMSHIRRATQAWLRATLTTTS